MSVINKMLRDLDARRLSAPGIPADSVLRVAASRWQAKPALPELQGSSKWHWILGLALIGLAAAAGHFSHHLFGQQQEAVTPVVKVQVPLPVAEPVIHDALVAATPLPAPDPIAAPAPSPSPSLVPAPAPVKPALPGIATAAMSKAEPLKTGPVTPAVSPAPAVNTAQKAAAPVPATAQANRQALAQETLAQAQGLWNTGSREAALDLMREAVTVTERAYNTGVLTADSPVLASLVRELARMELAEGRPARVLDLLIRLEPALLTQADLWAVRGNAAQRLARHQESLLSYTRALAIRPDEPRWMLASAVSLAALGRVDESAEQAEKANATGAVSPEILNYLKQVGVPVRQK